VQQSATGDGILQQFVSFFSLRKRLKFKPSKTAVTLGIKGFAGFLCPKAWPDGREDEQNMNKL